MIRQERVVINDIRPRLECGAFFIKRVVGEQVVVSADVLPDGHDVMQAEVLYKHASDRKWKEVRMRELINDRWEGAFQVDEQGFYQYKVRGWVDYALNWQHGIEAKLADGQHVRSELLDGMQYLKYLKSKVSAADKSYITGLIGFFESEESYEQAINEATSEKLHDLFLRYPQRLLANTSESAGSLHGPAKGQFFHLVRILSQVCRAEGWGPRNI